MRQKRAAVETVLGDTFAALVASASMETRNVMGIRAAGTAVTRVSSSVEKTAAAWKAAVLHAVMGNA